jgi:hypothetical protein
VLSGEVCSLHVKDCRGYGCFDIAFIACHLTKLLCFPLGQILPTGPIWPSLIRLRGARSYVASD